MSAFNGGLLSPSAKPEELALLAQLDEANRKLEADHKSLQSLSITNNTGKHSNQHSRNDSLSSIISSNSTCSNLGSMHFDDDRNDPEATWEIWGKIVNDWDSIFKKKPSYIKDMVRKGIPQHFRGIVWPHLCHALPGDKLQFAEYLKQTSLCEKVIRRDITRTYPEHDFFKEKNGLGQESLFNVIKAYSLYDREVGYCQGSGFIVGLLLMQMPEEEAFAVFVRIMQEYRLRELFKPSMANLGLCMFQLECMIQDQMPDLYDHFQRHGFYVSMFASSWFLTLFTTLMSVSAACRVFDIFLSEGMEVIFRVSFAILFLHREELKNTDMEGMLKLLQRDISSRYDQDIDCLIQASFQVRYNSRRMRKLEKEYNALKSKEQEEQVELRRLRTENRLLRQRIDNLEKETGRIADRLIHDQVLRAQREDELSALRRQLAQCQGPNSPSKTIEQLKSQLQEAMTRESEACKATNQLRGRVHQLEMAQHESGAGEPCQEVEQLQEELIASKMREAEAHLAMKELKQHVLEMDRCWQHHLESSGKLTKTSHQSLSDELMATRLRETTAMVEMKELKQRIMELETENQIQGRQIKRLEAETDKLKQNLEEDQDRERELKNIIKDFERQISDLQSKMKEDEVMGRIRDAEHSTAVAEMRQRIARPGILNQELVTAGKLNQSRDEEEQVLHGEIVDLKEEVEQLKMQRRLQSLSTLTLGRVTADSESDSDDLENSRLRLTDSMMGTDFDTVKRQKKKKVEASVDLNTAKSELKGAEWSSDPALMSSLPANEPELNVPAVTLEVTNDETRTILQ